MSDAVWVKGPIENIDGVWISESEVERRTADAQRKAFDEAIATVCEVPTSHQLHTEILIVAAGEIAKLRDSKGGE